ncbi:MAG: DUF2867 domain-containing protein [Proteobacteria bacterium]|nr:DUF2867 domain-containing protein [Pseudomonadota bacterium]MBU1454844.1 DUF2867 domain-containing protein [Pseudomonadota bacterium]
MDKIQDYKELDIYFQDVDHTDIKTIEGLVSLRSFIAGMLSYSPWWIAILYRMREILVNIFGLTRHEKTEVFPSIKPEDLSFEPGGNASIFIVRDAKEDVYWVAETPEDKQLKAFFGVVAEKVSNHRTRYHVFTSIKYIHWTGPVYFNLIRSFHHIVVSSMMKAGIKG